MRRVNEAGYTAFVKRYHCTICDKPVDFHAELPELFPFCSDRCKLVDLGKWFRGEYAMERDLSPEEIAARHRSESGDRSEG